MGFKTLLFAIVVFFGILSAQAQTVVFSEDFETLPLDMTSSGSTNWDRSSILFAGGSYSDTAIIGLSGTSYLTTSSFSTAGNYQVILEFDQICKIEFFDAGKIEYSIDGGTNWYELTTTEYTGSGSFLSNKFTANSYVADWQAATATAIPTNTWWKHESFNISALVGNQANVMLRFALSDGNNNGPNQNYGWLVDNVEVTMAVDETIPPVISLITPYPVDTVYNTGPFTVTADISDASGVDTADLVYTVNSGIENTLTMVNTTGDEFQGIIPAQSLYDTIRYYIYATDSAMTSNSSREPAIGTIQFIIKDSPPPPGCTTPIVAFPIIEDMETFTTGIPGTFANGWSSDPTTGFMWQIDAGGTPSGSTGPSVDHTLENSTGKYLYTEASSGSTGDSAFVYSPCIDITSLNSPMMSFWYHMYGSTTGELHVDVWYGNDWALDIVPPLVGQQQTAQTDPYQKVMVDLSAYKSITQIRFRAYRGSNYYSDMAIDDIEIYNLQQYDAGVVEMTEPITPAPTGTQDVKVKIMNFGYDVLSSATINWSVNGVSQTPFNWSGSVFSLDTSAEITVGTYNFTTGFYSMKFWTTVPSGFADQNTLNDTLETELVVCGGGLAGTYTIDASTGDFPTFNDAVLMLETCGITAPVVFNVASDTYDETITIGTVAGSSTTNTITFQSASGNATDVIIEPTTLPIDYVIVKFKNTSHIIWKDMTIEASAQTYARGFYFGLGADTITVSGNIINLPDVNTSSTSNTGFYDPGGINSNLSILNNTINEGSYGTYIRGSGTTNLQDHLIISGNTVQGYSAYGIYTYYMDTVTITNNIVKSDQASAYTTQYGIYSAYSDNGGEISGNDVQLLFSDNGYGLYLYYNDGTATNHMLIANNFVTVTGENASSTSYGIDIYNSSYADVVYNSSNMLDSYSSSRALYVTGGSNNTLQNNILANTGGGYAAFFSSTTSIITSDYNDLYTSGATLAYHGGARIDLAALQAASSKDLNSISTDPLYNSSTDLHTGNPYLVGAATPLTSVTDDIDGDTRSLTLPCIGADEFVVPAKNIALTQILTPASGCALTAGEAISIEIMNLGTDPITTFDAYYDINGSGPVMESPVMSIPSLGVDTFTFTTLADFSSYGIYDLDVYVHQATETENNNDSILNTSIESGYDFSTAYTMGFENGEDLSGWSIFNGDGHATYKWNYPYSSTTYSHTGSYSAQFYNNATSTGEDWMFTRCFPLEAGKTYKISYWYRAYSTSYPQTIMLAAGTTPSPAGMTNTIETIISFNNTTHVQSVNEFIAPTTDSYYFGWEGITGLAYYAYIDDINISLVPDQEASTIGFLSPIGDCGLSSAEPVTIQILNSGADTINGNLNASYKVDGGSVITEAVATQILPGDTLDYTFTATLDMSVTTQDSTFNILGWVDLIGDPNQFNDTTEITVVSGHIPNDPTVVDATIPYGTSAILSAFSLDSVLWFTDTLLAPFYIGQVYNTPILTDTVVYYVQAISEQANIKITELQAYGSGAGSTPSIPSYISGDDLIEIANLSNSPADLGGYSIEIFGAGANTYTFPSFTLNGNSVAVFYLGTGTDDPANNFYNMGGATISSSSALGIVLKNNSGTIIDAVAANGYTFDAGATGVQTSDWSGNVSSSSSRAGISRIISENNLATDWVVAASGGPIQTIGTLQTLTLTELLGCASNYVPITAFVLPPPGDFELTDILSPIGGCTDGIEYVQIKITNVGADTIDNPFDVTYQVNATAPVTENVSYVILPGDSITHTFITPIVLPLLAGDTTFTLTCYGNVVVDTYTVNDTMSASYTMNFTPPTPIAIHDTVPYGTSATVGAISTPYLVSWYDQPIGGNLLDTGLTYITPVLYGDQTYYIEATDGAGADTLTTTYAGGNGCGGGSMFNVTSLGSGITIDAFNINTGTIGTVSVNVYYKAGTYLGNETNPAAWTLLGAFNANGSGSNNPSYMDVTDFTIPAGQTYGIYLNFDADYTNASNTYSNSDIEISVAAGLCSLFGGVNAGRDFNGSVIYKTGTGCASPRDTVHAVVTGAPAVDAGISGITEPIGPIPLGVENVTAVLTNYGTNTLTSCDIAWTVNSVAQTPYNWAGTLLTGESDTITIGTYDFVYTPYPGLNDLVVWSENPNVTIDPTNANDTSSVVIDAHDPFNGTYYILTATPDFNSFNDAVVAINAWGVDGAVSVLAESGTYNEQVLFDTIPGASAINTVTFGSETGINTDVILQYTATGTTDNYVLNMNGTDYLTFENMTIRSDSAINYGRVITMNNGCNYNIFNNNIIEGIESTNSNAATVYCYNGGVDNGNVFSNNEIHKGYYGVYFYGSSTNKKAGNKFINNTIADWYYYGLYVYYNDSITIKGNELSNSATSSTNYHIYSYRCDNGTEISENTVNSTGTGTFYGIYLYYNNVSATIPNKVYNNFISQTGTSTGTAYGIYSAYTNYADIYFNSVHIAAGSTTTGRALYQTGGTSNVNIANNNFVNTGGGYAYYVNTPGVVSTSDYNNYYTTGSKFSYWSGDRVDLAAMQAVSFKDTASISVDPIFYSSIDLHTGQYFLYGEGTDIAGINTDIDGDARNTPPTIGADEYTLLTADAGIIKFDEPILTPPSGVNNVSVTLGNYSSVNLTSVDIAWEINGTPQTTVPWAGTLTTGTQVDSVFLAAPNFTWGIYNMKAWTEMPNGVADLNTYNDTAEYSIIVCDGGLKGNYTIGSTGDFSNINDAVTYMNYCGIDSVVVFDIETGIYAESVVIPKVTGMSSVNTVTFRSQTGNATDVVLQPTSIGSNYGIIEMDSAMYVSWENTTLDGDSLTNVRGFYLAGVNSITLDGNTILLPDVVSSSSNICGIYDASGVDSNTVIINNNIYNGSYGIYIYGNSSNYQPGLIVSNNNVVDYAYYGIYSYYLKTPTFTDNYIYTDTNTYSTIYGIRLYNTHDGYTITGNNVVIADKENGYGMYIYGSDGLSTSRGLIANNFVSFEGLGTTSTSYAVYMSSCDYVDVVFNSIHLYDSYASSRGYYVTSGSNIAFLNNNVAATGGAYAVYFNTTTAVTTSDYNNLYSSGTILGYYSGARADLAAWQTATADDINSYSMDPLFVSDTDLHIFLGSLDGKATPFTGITVDIDGDTRNVATPDIGADEFDGMPFDIAMTYISMPTMDYGFTTDADTVKVHFTNYGANDASGFTISYSVDGVLQATENYVGTLASGTIDSLEFATYFTPNAGPNEICAWISLTGDGDNSNDTVCTMYKGIPTLNAEYSDDFETNDYFGAQSATDSWEFGTPAGTVINSAYSPSTAWVTNLDGAYAFNMNDALYSPKFNFVGIYNAELRFYHQYDIEGGDIGYIEYSNNNGVSWNSLGLLNDPNGTNWYPSTVGSINGWNGTSTGWEYSSIDLSAFNNSPFPLQLRFILYSDFSGTNGEGWAIDNFEIFVPTPDIDAGVTSILTPAGILTPGSPESITLRIENFGADTLTSIPVVVTVTTGQPPITATWTGSLLPGDSADYSLPSSYTPLTISNFDMCAYTDLANDLIYHNDTTCISLSTNVGIEEAYALQNIQVNPNPAKDFTILEFNTAINGNALISIRTPEGKLVQAKEVYISSGENAFRIETQSFAAGVYIWRINSNDVSEEGKLIIVR